MALIHEALLDVGRIVSIAEDVDGTVSRVAWGEWPGASSVRRMQDELYEQVDPHLRKLEDAGLFETMSPITDVVRSVDTAVLDFCGFLEVRGDDLDEVMRVQGECEEIAQEYLVPLFSSPE